MHRISQQYIYFESLENTIKFGLALYVTALIVGCFTAVAGFDNLMSHFSAADWMIVAGEMALVGILFAGLYYLIGKVHWLGELHIRLDRRFFGFLLKSNDVIYRTLVSTLQGEEQVLFNKLPEAEKTTLTQSIFSRLSNDNQLFDDLLTSGIFRSWIKYWVTIYGSFTFLLLSLVTFVAALFSHDDGAKMFFGINWGFAILHLAVSSFWGRMLVRKTEASVQQIVEIHKKEITEALEENLAAHTA